MADPDAELVGFVDSEIERSVQFFLIVFVFSSIFAHPSVTTHLQQHFVSKQWENDSNFVLLQEIDYF